MSRKTRSMQDIDQKVGQNIRWFRMQRGLSQHALAQLLGISYQQLYKYENGLSSIAASRLSDISRTLNVPISSLFDGMDKMQEHTLHPAPDVRVGKEEMQFIRYYNALAKPDHREAIRTLILTLSDENER